MRKVLASIFLITTLLSSAQIEPSYEWMTSLDFAQRLARAQNKMMLAMWEGAAIDFQTPIIEDGSKRRQYVSILDNYKLNEILWEHFVLVVLNENNYAEMLATIKDKRSQRYIDKFNDDTVKIMDANGNIINTRDFYEDYFGFDLEKLLRKYAFSTKYLSEELNSYFQKRTFISAYRLARKYVDLAIVKNKDVEKEFMDMAIIYINEAKEFALKENAEEQKELLQKCTLLSLYETVLKDRPKKVLRSLKEIEKEGLLPNNQKLFDVLTFTSFVLSKDRKNIELWRDKVSAVDLDRIRLITNKNQ